MSAASKVRKFFSMPRADRRLLFGAAWRVALVRLALSLLPYRLWSRWLVPEVEPLAGSCVEGDLRRQRRVAAAVRLASRSIPRANTCLVHAIATQLLLVRAGLPGAITVGVGRTPEGAFEAHAWVECRGQIIIGDHPDRPLDETFSRLMTLSRKTPRPRRDRRGALGQPGAPGSDGRE